MTRNPNNFDFTKYTNIQDHMMGVTVLHNHSFGELPSTYLGTGLEKECEPFYMTWVDPYYLNVGGKNADDRPYSSLQTDPTPSDLITSPHPQCY